MNFATKLSFAIVTTATAWVGWATAAQADTATDFSLTNDHVSAKWHMSTTGQADGSLTEKSTGESVNLNGALFSIVMPDGTIESSAGMTISGSPKIEQLESNSKIPRVADREPGQQLTVELTSTDGSLHATWRAILREGSNYLREQLTLTAEGKATPLKEILMLDIPMANAHTSGSVDGSPVVTKTMFFGVEHPLSINRGEIGHVRCFLPRGAALAPGETYNCSMVIGFARDGQMRRDFLAYLERERARPYQPFVTYNTWYDLGYFNKYTEDQLVKTINEFGKNLVTDRHVKMNSFLMDDGWDDSKTLWRPHHDFPDGFAAASKAAAHYGAALGIWLSPWGGYGQPKIDRITQGKKDGYEVVDGSFSLAGPKYFERFRSLCMDVVKKFGVNQFKFDGIGSETGVTGSPTSSGEQTIRDFEAMLRLIAELRASEPGIYINQTTGTWPSPFWLESADSIWRGGDDTSETGAGSDRQRWITYRDMNVYEGVVAQGSLYPINSLMIHGIVYAHRESKLRVDPKNDFQSEVRSFFASGTQLQELYISPDLLTPANWDSLAEAANWSRANADTLVDSHWVGGDPGEGHVYGWASWSPRKGILALRNPGGNSDSIDIDLATVFELPDGAARQYDLTSPYKDQRITSLTLRAGEKQTITLKPFEVLVFDAMPKAAAGSN